MYGMFSFSKYSTIILNCFPVILPKCKEIFQSFDPAVLVSHLVCLDVVREVLVGFVRSGQDQEVQMSDERHGPVHSSHDLGSVGTWNTSEASNKSGRAQSL